MSAPDSQSAHTSDSVTIRQEAQSFRIVGEAAPLFAALAKAQGAFDPIVRSRVNPFFKSKYAELSDVIAATRPALCANGLTVLQPQSKEGDTWEIRTILAHSSGAYLETVVTMPHVGDWQKVGAAQTYCRRYCYSAMVGVASEDDDDGNVASDAEPRKSQPTPPKYAQEAGRAPRDEGKPKPAQQSAPKAVEKPAPAPEPDPQNQHDGPPYLHSQPPADRPSQPSDESQRVTPETKEKLRGLLKAMGLKGEAIAPWCVSAIGKPPQECFFEAEYRALVVKAEQELAARPNGATP
jgi:hypothetical protein